MRSVRFLFLGLLLLLILPNKPGAQSQALGADEARELLDKARRIAFTLPAQGNPPVRDILLRKIAVSQARAGYTSDALLTLAAVEDPERNFKPSAYALIALMQARKGEGMDALRTALQIEVEPWRSLAAAQVAVTQARTGFVGGALQTAVAIRDSDQRNRVLMEIMVAQLEQEDLMGAENTASMIEGEDWKLRAVEVIEEWETSGKLKEVPPFFIIEEGPAIALVGGTSAPDLITDSETIMLPTSQAPLNVPSPAPPAVRQALGAVRDAFTQVDDGNPQVALETLRRAVGDTRRSSLPRTRAALGLLAMSFAELGEVEEALEIASVLQSRLGLVDVGALDHAMVLNRIAYAEAVGGRARAAVARVEQERGATAQAFVLLGVAEGIQRRIELESNETQVPESP